MEKGLILEFVLFSCSDVPKGAIELKGSKSSYLEITNNGKLDAHKSITILANVFPTGSDGPIVAYDPMGKGVHLWQFEKTQLFVRFTTRGSNGSLTLEPLATRVLQVRDLFLFNLLFHAYILRHKVIPESRSIGLDGSPKASITNLPQPASPLMS